MARLLFLVWCAWACSAWQLPAIPAGHRAEYYLQHADGGYKFGYDTGLGQAARADADASNEVHGAYQYVDHQGHRHSLSYTAGRGGFLPISGAASATGTDISSAAVSRTSASVATPQEGDVDYDPNADASYSFNIDTDSYKRTETADARGNVRGQYSYSGPHGGQAVSYVAGEGTGFVVTSNDVTGGTASSKTSGSSFTGVQPGISQGAVQPDGSYSFAFSDGDQSRQEQADARNNVRGSYSFKTKDDGLTRRVDYSAGASTGFVASGAHLPKAQESELGPVSRGFLSSSDPLADTGDATYSFSFQTGEQARQEASDARGNVQGRFSYIAPDGVQRQVDYEAGAEKGFVAKGAHLPVPVVPVPAIGVVTAYSSPAVGPSFQTTHGISPSTYSSPALDSSAAVNTDGTYSFSYNAADHSRQESADAQNNVKGSFTFRSKDDGQTRRIDYQAGSATGFVARGSHLPVPPAAVSGTAPSSYSVPSVSTPGSSYRGPQSNAKSSVNQDGSYSFSYGSDDHSREESADAANNVRGSFSFRSKDDGQTRKVDYIAGSSTGFVAKGSHIPEAASAVSASHRNVYTPEVSHTYLPPAVPSLKSYSTNVKAASGESSDGSYSFSYNTQDHSREESADAQGNVRGSFSFIAKDDGQRRKVDYEAGAEKGFIAKGVHLPVPVAAVPVPAQFPAVPAVVAARTGSPDSGDASFSYSYNTDSSSKTESSDAQGNVRGEYSYLGGDGITRKVQYTSRGDEGFVVSGDAASAQTAGAVSAFSKIELGRAAGSPNVVNNGNFVVHKYLPPESKQKFGYIFEKLGN